MNMTIIETLRELITTGESLVPKGGKAFEGYNGQLQPDYVSWRLQAIAAVEELGKTARPLLKDLESDKQGPYFYQGSTARVLGVLKGALAIAERQARAGRPQAVLEVAREQGAADIQDAVFVVHGHDDALRSQVARFLEKLEIRAVLLFEQPGRGKTVIEKLEANSTVKFAVVLLTPDDVGRAVKDEELRPRARQNVILELGYFMGRLGRSNVAVLYDESVELLSDYRGVEYIKVDAEGAWRLRLARELKEAGLAVDMNRAI